MGLLLRCHIEYAWYQFHLQVSGLVFGCVCLFCVGSVLVLNLRRGGGQHASISLAKWLEMERFHGAFPLDASGVESKLRAFNSTEVDYCVVGRVLATTIAGLSGRGR